MFLTVLRWKYTDSVALTALSRTAEPFFPCKNSLINILGTTKDKAYNKIKSLGCYKEILDSK